MQLEILMDFNVVNYFKTAAVQRFATIKQPTALVIAILCILVPFNYNKLDVSSFM
jgi:hypothetical protein